MVRHSRNTSELWKKIPWRKLRKNLFRLQCRVFKAMRAGDRAKVLNLQKLILKSRSARLLAIRQVTQLNAGKKTAGVDGKASLTHQERFELATQLMKKVNCWKHQKLRAIPIPKKDGTKRVLKVPTIADRAWQCLVKYALEPAHEATFHERSYGFRTGRAAHDAQKMVFQNLKSSVNGYTKKVLELDIEKCFDRIDHTFLMEQIVAPQFIKEGIFISLKAGINPEFPEQGTPQGGVYSPLLANIALNGIESCYRKRDKWRRYSEPCIRYADDLVFFIEEQDDESQVLDNIEKFLAIRGLNIKAEKTRIVASTDGFDFLGWHFKVQSNGKFQCVPSADNYEAFRKKIKTIINSSNYGAEVKSQKLAPIVRGWRNYHRNCDMSSTRDSLWFISHRAWKVFNKEVKLTKNQVTRLVEKAFPKVPWSENKHINVKGDKSPFDGDLTYWCKRESILYSGDTAKALKRQQHTCGKCGLKFCNDERIHLHHVDGNHQNWKQSNLIAVHESCHDYLHMSKGTSQDCREPDARKRARPDLTERGEA